MPSPAAKKAQNTTPVKEQVPAPPQDDSKTVEIPAPQDNKTKRRRPKVAADSVPAVKKEEPAPAPAPNPVPELVPEQEERCVQILIKEEPTSLPVNLAALTLTAYYGLQLYFAVRTLFAVEESCCVCAV